MLSHDCLPNTGTRICASEHGPPYGGHRREETARAQPVGSDRVLAVLAELARHPEGIARQDLAGLLHSPQPTIHRALAALHRAGFAAQHRRGPYLLGDEFLRLAFANHEARPDHLRVQPILEQLVARDHEVSHYAVLEVG